MNLNDQKNMTANTTVNKQIEFLDKQLIDVQNEIQKLIEKRDRLNQQFKLLRDETRELKTERDSINEKVHSLKEQRDETRTTIMPAIEEIKAAREKITELKKKIPKRSQRDLQQEFDDIEWRIQTNSLDLQEEKRLIEEVKALEIQLSAYRKIDQQRKKIYELQIGLREVDETGDKLHTELSTMAQKSQDLHQVMITKIELARKVKQEADATHNAYLLAREKARQLEEEQQKLRFEVRRIRIEERKQREEQLQIREAQQKDDEAQRLREAEGRKAAEKELRGKLGTQVREKLQRGEQLNWDEFQLLAGEEEEETQN